MARTVPTDAILIPSHATRVFKGVIYDVYQWEQELYDGSMATFERLRRPDTVCALCIRGGRITFVKEEQPGRIPYISLPGGRVEAGEDWDDAVKRECLEELGMRFGQWRLVDVQQPVTKIEWFVATYVATDFMQAEDPHHDAGERITTVAMTFDEAKQFLAESTEPFNAYLRQLFTQAKSLEGLAQLPDFSGKTL